MKNMIFKSVLLVLLFAGISFGQDYFANAQKAVKKGDIAGAFNFAKEAFQKDSTSAAWKILLQIKDQKHDPELLDLLAKVWEKMGVVDNAISNYEEADKLDPKNIARKYILADLYFKNDKIKEAANEYLNIIQTDSTSKEAYLKVGEIFYLAKGNFYADAGVYLEKALKFYDNLDIYHKCVLAYIKANNPAKAFEVSIKGLEKYPNDMTLKREAWQNALNSRKYEEALKYVVQVPDSLLTAQEAKIAGDVALMLKKQELNDKYYRLAADKDPNNKDLFLVMADKAYKDKDYDKAIEYYNKKLAMDPKNADALNFKAWSYKLKGDWEGARQAFLDYTAVYDSSISGYLNLAECYDKLDSTSRKADIYSKLMKMIDGKEKEYKDVAIATNYFFGYRAYTGKNWSGAIPYLKKILVYKGEDVNILVMISACYENMKDYDNAVAYLKRAQKINPNDENVKKGLRRLSAD